MQNTKIDISELKLRLAERGIDLIAYPLTDSTNLRAVEYAREEKPKKPTVFIADEQSAGRGRLGRSFLSPMGGLYMTILTKTDGKDNFISLTTHAANSVARSLESILGVSVMIKWVNDIYLRGRKLAGILAQGITDTDTGAVEYVALGIGLNILGKELPDEIKDIATTLEREGVSADRNSLALGIALEYLTNLCTAGTPESADEYRGRSFVIGKQVRVLLPDRSFNAKVRGITDNCELMLRLDNGEEMTLSTGEVSIRLDGDSRGAKF